MGNDVTGRFARRQTSELVLMMAPGVDAVAGRCRRIGRWDFGASATASTSPTVGSRA